MKNKEPKTALCCELLRSDERSWKRAALSQRFQTNASGIALRKPGSSNSNGGLRIGQKLNLVERAISEVEFLRDLFCREDYLGHRLFFRQRA
jgi:hypothetical protein